MEKRKLSSLTAVASSAHTLLVAATTRHKVTRPRHTHSKTRGPEHPRVQILLQGPQMLGPTQTSAFSAAPGE